MAEDKPAYQPPEMLQHLIAARDTLLADDPDRSAPNRARMPLASALTALGAEAETKPLYESVLTDHPSHPAAAKARAEAALAAEPTELTRSASDFAQDAAAHLEMARSCLKQHDLSAAQALFDSVLANDPENLPAQIGCID